MTDNNKKLKQSSPIAMYQLAKEYFTVGQDSLAAYRMRFHENLRHHTNIPFAIFGGTSPMVAVWLIGRTGDDLSFAWYISGAAMLSFLIALTLKDRRNEPLI